ncbi:MAG: hypothetical protein DRP01_07935 [Archaeoglobales archaeon]|nr:MAG: hypothetical protein DRP01_07935 [Archaeoglobales archaeon]
MKRYLLILLCLVCVGSAQAYVGGVTGVTIEDVSTEYAGREAVNIIDGNGFTEATGVHVSTFESMWMNDVSLPTTITFDLEANYALGDVTVWNYNEYQRTGRGAKDVEILIADTEASPTFVSLGSFVFDRAPGTESNFAQVIDLTSFAAADDARLVRFVISSNWGPEGGPAYFTGLSEVRFTLFGTPTVDAGPDQQVILPTNTAVMDANAVDDGLPSALTYAWTVVSGGTVNFDDAAIEDPTATFPGAAPGDVYVLKLSVYDGQLTVADTVEVSFADVGVLEFIDYFDGNTIDTLEWAVTEGTGSVTQDEALRVDANGVEWNNAWVTTVDGYATEDGRGTTLAATVRCGGGQAGTAAIVGFCDDITPFAGDYADMLYGFVYVDGGTLRTIEDGVIAGDVSIGWGTVDVRITLDNTSGALWEYNKWGNDGSGWVIFADTRDTSPVSNAGAIWKLSIETRTGYRNFNQVMFTYGTFGDTSDMPWVSAGGLLPGLTHIPDELSLDGWAVDGNLPASPGYLTYAWTQVDGPGTATFDDASAEDPNVTFDVDGVYRLKLTVDDGLFTPFGLVTLIARDEDFILNADVSDSNDSGTSGQLASLYTHHNYIEDAQWSGGAWAIATTTPGNEWVIFDLGGQFSLYKIDIWNHSSTNEDFNEVGVKSMNILASNDPDFGGTPESLVDITVLPKGIYGPDAETTAYVSSYSTAPTGGPYRYIKLDFNSNHGDPNTVGLTQVDFYGTTTDDCTKVKAHQGYQQMEKDWDNSCRIDLGDFAIFAAEWLDEHIWMP